MHSQRAVVKTVTDYGISIFIAIVVALIYVLFEAVYKNTTYWRIKMLTKYFDKEQSIAMAWVFAIGVSSLITLMGGLGGLLEPCSTGCGMPEVMAYLNGAKIRKYISWRTLVLKVFGLMCINSAGLFSGYDGPMAHIGLIVAVLVVKGIRKLRQWYKSRYLSIAGMHRDSTDKIREKMLLKRADLIFAATGCV
jgi:H+/Cl- antiporter ClcA